MSPEEREQRIRAIAERLAERLAEQWPEAGSDINDLEDFAERLGREVQREITDEALTEDAARQDGSQSACPCGGTANYQRHHALTLVTAAGRCRVRRPYYYCRRCSRGHCPADTRLRLGPANTTPRAQARIAVLAALEPYVQVADLCVQLGLPLELDVKSTEQVAQAVGHCLGPVALRPHGPATRPVAVGFDGVMLRTWEGKKEARVGVVYEPDWEAGRTPADEARLHKEYFATTGSRESLVAAVCRRARERAGAGVVAVVCDGAALDWVDLEAYLPHRVEILDFYHVLERVGQLAQALHPEAPVAAAAWQAEQKQALLAGGPASLLRCLRAWEPASEAAQALRREQLAYFTRQQGRMRYPDFLRWGFPVGSGAVEGACKHVVSDRCRRSGMRWKLPTADPLLRLRAALLTQPRLDFRQFAVSRSAPPAVPAA